VKSRNFLWVTLGTVAVGLGVLVGGFARTGRAQAPEAETVTCRADFPFMGLVGREQARVHVSWVEGQGEPVVVKTQFFDRGGQPLQEDTQPLAPNETVSTKFDPEDRTENSKRIQFRAAVLIETATGGPGFPAETGCPQVIASLERTTHSGAGVAIVPPGIPIGWMHKVKPSPCPSPSLPPDMSAPDSQPPLVDMHPPDAPNFVDVRPPDAPFVVDAPISFPDAQISFPDAPISFPDAPIAPPDAFTALRPRSR
jgi:hypothetical protein